MRMLLAQASAAVEQGLNQAGATAGYSTNLELTTLVANIITAVLGLTGIALVCLLVYAGVLYLTAGGAEDNVKKAKKLLSSSVIGIMIIVSSYALASYVFSALNRITN